MDCVIEFLSENFQNCIWLAVVLVAMCPTLESKIAIPLAMNTSIWGINALNPVTSFLLASLGTLIPSYLIMFFARKLKHKTTGFVSSKFLQKYTIRGAGIENKNSKLKQYLALAGFVAVPLPLTGVWTGSLIAGLTNLNLNYSFLAISVGSLISSGAVTILCTIFTNSISYIFMISLIIVIAFLFIDLFISLFKRKITNVK